MGVHQLQMALLVPDDSLLHFSQLINSFKEENLTSFSQLYLPLFLCLMDPKRAI